MTLPPLPDCQSATDLSSLRRQIRYAREALVRARHELDIQISSLDKMAEELKHPVEPAPPPKPFQAPPAVMHEPRRESSLTVDYLDAPGAHIVLEATRPATLEQHLEQATLEELNQALSKAFAQVSGRSEW